MDHGPQDARRVLRVLRAQAGDRAALEALLKEAQPRLMAFLLRMLGNHADAEDVLQDVLLIIARKLGWLQSAALFSSWSYRIAAREAIRRRRRRDVAARRHEPLEDAASAPEPARPPAEEIERAERLLPSLTSNSLAVIVLHYYEGQSLGETAEVLGIPAGTAKSRLAQALNSLRRQMGPPA